jgi:hypothetical protein
MNSHKLRKAGKRAFPKAEDSKPPKATDPPADGEFDRFSNPQHVTRSERDAAGHESEATWCERHGAAGRNVR